MDSFITWAIIAAFLLLVFAIGMLVGIKRKSLNMVLFSVAMCLLGIGAVVVAVFLFLRGHYLQNLH